MKAVNNYIKATNKLVNKFIKTYYTDEDGCESDYYLIGGWDRLCAGPLEVDDMFWSIDNIFEALLHNIPKDVLFAWYDYSYDKHIGNKVKEKPDTIVNLTSFALGAIEYTDEEKGKDRENVDKYWNLLRDSMKK